MTLATCPFSAPGCGEATIAPDPDPRFARVSVAYCRECYDARFVEIDLSGVRLDPVS